MSGASFKGNLEILNLSDIFQSLAMNRHSGALIISDGKREKKIYFAEGEIQLLSSSRRMKLGELLIATGKITEDDLDLALKLQKQNRKKLGEILVEEGFCDEEDIARIVKFQIEEEIYDLFLWRKAEFEFLADYMPEEMKRDNSNLMRLQLNTNSLIMEALRRLDEWELVKQAVPSTKEIFVVVDENSLGSIELPERLKNEIHLIDGKTNVEGLAEKTMISEFELCKLLAELVNAGAIKALPMEQLVQKAEEAYAVNDFSAAAALYQRLAELVPGEPKVLIPLAESLRRSGDDRQALAIFEEIAQKLDPARDAERLRRCYETIIALDPDRADIVKKLQEMEQRAESRRRKGVALPVGVVVAVVLALAGAIFHKPILAGLSSALANKEDEKRRQEEVLAGKLLEQMNVEQNITKNYQKWHELAVKIWTEYPQSRAREKVTLPILVTTQPTGYAVSINGLPKGVTTAAEPIVVGEYTTRVDRVVVQVRKLVGGTTPNQDVQPIAERVIDDPKSWPGEVVFTIEDKYEGRIIPDAPIDVELAWHPEKKSFFGVSRDGHVYVLDEKLERQEGWKDVEVGPFADVFSAATLIGNKAYVGVSAGGVAVVDLDRKSVQTGLFPAEGSVAARPLVMSRAGRVVFGTTAGVVYGYPLEGRSPKWRQETDGAIVFPGVLADDEGTSIVFASNDERCRAFDVATGRVLWKGFAGVPSCAPLRVRTGGQDAVAVAAADGSLVALSSKTGKPVASWKDPRGRRFRAIADESGDMLLLATEDGRVYALDAKNLAPLWPKEFMRPGGPADASTRLPTLAWLPASGAGPTAIPPRVFVAFDDSRLYGLDPKTGLLAYQANVESGALSGPLTVQGPIFIATTPTSVYLFRRQ